MHRSGTSLVTSYLVASGFEPGSSLVPAAPSNPQGFFEHTGFLDWNRRLLDTCTPREGHGHRDWGFTESESFDDGGLAAFEQEAVAFADGLARAGVQVLKDPRATLLLDFWHGVLPDTRYLLLYRNPWDVADSLQRLGAPVFLERPDYAYPLWRLYNRKMLDFYQKHKDRSMLVSVQSLVEQPEIVDQLFQERFGVDLSTKNFDQLLAEQGLRTLPPSDPMVRLFAHTSPETAALLVELDGNADLPRPEAFRQAAVGAGSAAGTKAGVPAGAAVDLSVVIPCFNDGELLVDAIASVERVVACRYEILIVDDGSIDERTLQILAALEQCGYLVLRQPDNRGLSAARNRGFEEARGKYLLPLDADNRLLPGFVEVAIEELETRSGLGIVYGDRVEFGLRQGRVPVGDFDLPELLRSNYIDACALLRKEVWQTIGGYDEDLPAWEDWDFWIRAAEQRWEFEHLDIPAFDYRVRPGSLATIVDDETNREAILRHVISEHRATFDQHLFSELPPLVQFWFGLIERERAEFEARSAELERQLDALRGAAGPGTSGKSEA